MTQKSICLALLVCALVCSAGRAGEELLKNPSFEERGTDANTAADWNRWGLWVNYEDTWTPTHSGKAMIGYHHWQIDTSDDSGIWQDAKVQAGKTYSFSIFVFCDDPGADHEAHEIELRLEANKDGQQQTIKSTSTACKDIGYGKWKRLEVTAVAPADVLRVLVRVVPSDETPRSGAVKFDDASLMLSVANAK